MLSDLKTILRDIGGILIIAGLVMGSVLVISWIYSEEEVIIGILLPALIAIEIGLVLKLLCRNAENPELRHAMITAALSWLIIAALSALPFIMIEGMTPLDSFFEGMSGWTGTGLTMIPQPSKLTHTLQFWRSLMQWVGGVGVIVLMVSILARPGTGAYVLYKSEAREEKIRPSIVSTVRTIWWIYLLFTVVGVVLFFGAGMPLWDAINHGMTGLATGGFSIKDNSIASYDSPLIEAAIIPIMFLGAIPFLIHYRVLKGDYRSFIKDVQCKAMLIIVGIGCLVLMAEHYITGMDILGSIRFSVFQFISGLTCTGFQTTDIHLWSPTAQIIVSFSMVIGGAAGSTAGGIKLIRAVLAYKGSGLWFKRASLPRRAIISFRLGDRILSEDNANKMIAETMLITVLWIIFLFLGIIVMLHLVSADYGLSDVILEVASAQGNVGLSTGITGPDMSPFAKIMLIFNMWIGRLEIIPIMMLFRSLIRGLKPY